MKSSTGYSVAAAVCCSLIHTTAVSDMSAPANNEWQMKLLFNPSTAQLRREHDNHVLIYHNLPDKLVELAVDEQFERLDSMMFTGIIVTDQQGSPVTDPATGEIITEDDGCD